MSNYNDIQRLKDKEKWQEWIDNNKDEYGGQCVKVAYHLMKRIDDPKVEITEAKIHTLIVDADNKTDEPGISGYMAGAVASMVSACHERGDEFRRAWNRDTQIGDEGDKANEGDGVLNPALMNINV